MGKDHQRKERKMYVLRKEEKTSFIAIEGLHGITGESHAGEGYEVKCWRLWLPGKGCGLCFVHSGEWLYKCISRCGCG